MSAGERATSSNGVEPFSVEAWAATARQRKAIDELPFVVALGDGELDRERFVYYLTQDLHYLAGYARALAAVAVKAESREELRFFLSSAQQAVVAEQELHGRHVATLEGTTPSPTCTGYVSYLLGLAHTASRAELVAGVLPCFWVYADVGRTLLDRAGDLSGHPYGDWIGTYVEDGYVEAVDTARAITDQIAARADPTTVTRMHEAFATAVRWEWMFWDAAWRMESWPV